MMAIIEMEQGRIKNIKNPGDWKIELHSDGTLNAVAEKTYSGKPESVFVTMDPIMGLMSTIVMCYGSLKLTGQRRIPKTPIAGKIGLSGGRIRDRYAYFQDQKFADWLKENNLTTVRSMNPNKEFEDVINDSKTFHVLTDGTITVKETETADDTPVLLQDYFTTEPPFVLKSLMQHG